MRRIKAETQQQIVCLFEPEIQNFPQLVDNITFPPPLSPPSYWDQKTIFLPLCKHCAICTAPFVEAKSDSSSVSSLRCMIHSVLPEIWCGRSSFRMCESNKLKPAFCAESWLKQLPTKSSIKITISVLRQNMSNACLFFFKCHNSSGQKCCLLNICGLIWLSALLLHWGKVKYIGSHKKRSSDGGLSITIQTRVETPAGWRPGSPWWLGHHCSF